MTFKQIWTALKTTWQSRPLALILPVIALGVFWWTHGHTWTKASFPSMGEWIAGTTLLFTKFGRVMAVFVGEAAPETLPPPVVAPLLKPPSADVPKVGIMLAFLGLALGVTGCAHVQPYVGPVVACVGVDIAPYIGRISGDLAGGDFGDLDALAIEKGIPFVACVVRAILSKPSAGNVARNGSEWLKARDVTFVD